MNWKPSFYSVIVGAIVLTGFGIQTGRAVSRAHDITTLQDRVAKLEGIERTYGRWVLSLLLEEISSKDSTELSLELPDTGILMIVDRNCPLCSTVLGDIMTYGLNRPLYIGSFMDSNEEIMAWLEDAGASFPVIPVRLEDTYLSRLPNVSPIFVMFEDGMPAGVRMGIPEDHWMRK